MKTLLCILFIYLLFIICNVNNCVLLCFILFSFHRKLIGNPTEGIEILKQISEKDELYPINSSVDKIIPTLKIASKFLKKDVYYYRKKGFIVKADKHESLRSLTILFTAVMLWTRKVHFYCLKKNISYLHTLILIDYLFLQKKILSSSFTIITF